MVLVGFVQLNAQFTTSLRAQLLWRILDALPLGTSIPPPTLHAPALVRPSPPDAVTSIVGRAVMVVVCRFTRFTLSLT